MINKKISDLRRCCAFSAKKIKQNFTVNKKMPIFAT